MNISTNEIRDTPTNEIRDTSTEIPTSFTLLFIRHGISCANLRKETMKMSMWSRIADHTRILDPGLTKGGIIKATKRGEMLRQAIRELNTHTPLVCASTLVRAQQTALLMMDPLITPDNQLHILPYMSEVGLFKTRDNTPRPLPAQLAFLQRQHPDMADIQDRLDTSSVERVTDANIPNLVKFKEFLGVFLRANAVATVVLFTHGNFIAKLLKSLGHPIEKSDRPNYVAYKIRGEFTDDSSNLTLSLDSSPEFTYALNDLNSQTSNAYRFKYLSSRTLKADIECRLEDEHQACEVDVCTPSVRMSGGGRSRRRLAATRTRRTTRRAAH